MRTDEEGESQVNLLFWSTRIPPLKAFGLDLTPPPTHTNHAQGSSSAGGRVWVWKIGVEQPEFAIFFVPQGYLLPSSVVLMPLRTKSLPLRPSLSTRHPIPSTPTPRSTCTSSERRRRREEPARRAWPSWSRRGRRMRIELLSCLPALFLPAAVIWERDPLGCCRAMGTRPSVLLMRVFAFAGCVAGGARG